jgi:DNA-binding MarR family transcriptional regulator
VAQVEPQGKQVAVDDDLERIGEGLANVFRAGHTGRFHARLAATAGVDLDRTGFVMLGKVAHAGSIRVSDLAEQMGLDISTVSRKAQQLESAGLVERTGDPDDRRAAMLSIAIAGKRTLGLMRRERSRAIGELTADWPPEDRRRFADLLERFSQRMLNGPGGAA